MSTTPLADELARLTAAEIAAKDRRDEARVTLRRERVAAAHELAAPIVKFRDDIAFARPGATPPDERAKREVQLTRDFCEALIARGAVLRAVGKGGAVEIRDLALERAADEAEAAYVAASRKRAAFLAQHQDELDAELRAADADAIREALAGDDGDRIREALSGR